MSKCYTYACLDRVFHLLFTLELNEGGIFCPYFYVKTDGAAYIMACGSVT